MKTKGEMMLELKSRAPDLPVLAVTGAERSLAKFRRNSHVVLINEPVTRGGPDRWAWVRRRVSQDSQRWTWLQAAVVRPIHPPASLAPGAYVISRWADVI